MSTLEDARALNDAILSRSEDYWQWFTEDIVRRIPGKTIACSEELVGLEACQRQGQEFLDALTAPNRLELRSLAVDEENGVSFVEYYHEFEHQQWGRFRQVQVHVQRWRDGKVFEEDIYCGQQAKKS